LLAGGTVVAAVLALALQETLGNLFAGIALHLEDSFEVGDVIRSGDYIGTVETVSWRATRIRTFNNDVAILPNSVLARDRLEIHPRNNFNGRVLSVGIDWHVPPAVAIDILAKAAAHVEGVSRDMPCFARVASFGESSVTYDVKYFVRDYSQRDRIDADIRKALWYAMRRNNIAVPFPIRAFQPYTPPESKAHHDVSRVEILDLLREVDILSPLSDSAHEAIADAAKVHFYSKGEAILRLGAAGDSMFVVHDGTVSVRVGDDEVARLGGGSVFGEMALLTGEARTADVVALTDVTTIEIGKDALEPILHDHPELAAAISHKMMERRRDLETLRADAAAEEESTVLTRIRAYFGL
jgi:CRP-like cAMP-binding protein